MRTRSAAPHPEYAQRGGALMNVPFGFRVIPAFDTVEFSKIRPQDSRNPAIPWQTSATLTHSRISVMVKLNFRASIVLTRRTPNQLDAIANGKKIRVVFSWLS